MYYKIVFLTQHQIVTTSETTGAVQARRFDGFPPDLGHDVTLAAQVFVAER